MNIILLLVGSVCCVTLQQCGFHKLYRQDTGNVVSVDGVYNFNMLNGIGSEPDDVVPTFGEIDTYPVYYHGESGLYIRRDLSKPDDCRVYAGLLDTSSGAVVLNRFQFNGAYTRKIKGCDTFTFYKDGTGNLVSHEGHSVDYFGNVVLGPSPPAFKELQVYGTADESYSEHGTEYEFPTGTVFDGYLGIVVNFSGFDSQPFFFPISSSRAIFLDPNCSYDQFEGDIIRQFLPDVPAIPDTPPPPPTGGPPPPAGGPNPDVSDPDSSTCASVHPVVKYGLIGTAVAGVLGGAGYCIYHFVDWDAIMAGVKDEETQGEAAQVQASLPLIDDAADVPLEDVIIEEPILTTDTESSASCSLYFSLVLCAIAIQ